jgi:hypothetical protein
MMNHQGNINLSIDDQLTKTNSCQTNNIKSPKKIPTTEQTTNNTQSNNKIYDNNRLNCHKCDKKLKISAMQCKCNKYFCNAHKYSDCHNCKYDYKKIGKEILKKNNPIILHSKIDKI